MCLRDFLAITSGALFLTVTLLGLSLASEGAKGADRATAEAARVHGEDADTDPAERSSSDGDTGAGAGNADPGPPITWRVRTTQSVLDDHFEPGRFRMNRGENFVVLHDTDHERASKRADLLDLTYQRFHEAFGDFYELDQTEHPLVCVLFSNQEDFGHYARQEDRLDMSWSGGYYSSQNNRMVLYDHTPAEQLAEENTQPDERYERSSQGNRENSGEHDGADGHGSELVLLAAVDEAGAAASSPLNLASTTHEAAHQLAFNTGLQRRGVMYPFWVSEGLACAFETNHPHEPFGLGKPNPTRLDDLRRTMDENALMPMERFVVMTRPPTRDRQKLNAVYAQAWALFQFLYLHERQALSDYLATLASLPAGRRSSEALYSEFVEAFGSIEALEQRWRDHLQTLR